MNPHDRFYRDCQNLPHRKPRKCAEWLLIALLLTSWLWMLGHGAIAMLTLTLDAAGVFLLALIGDEVMRRLAAADTWSVQ